MDKPILTAFLLSVVSISVFGQESKNQAPTREVKKEVKSENGAPAQNSVQTVNAESQSNIGTYPQEFSVDQNGVQYTHDKAYFEQKLASVDELMRAIEVKEEYVRSSPEEHVNATQNGWYDNMSKMKEQLKEEKIALQRKIDSF